MLENSSLALIFLPGNNMINGKFSFGDLDIFSMSNFNAETVSVTCTFIDNKASTEAGVIAASSGSSFHVANSSFSNNSVDIRVNMTSNNNFGFGTIAVALSYCCSNILSFDQSSLNLSGNTSFVNNMDHNYVYAAVSNVTFSGFTRFENWEHESHARWR
jgi:hypothetical protein